MQLCDEHYCEVDAWIGSENRVILFIVSSVDEQKQNVLCLAPSHYLNQSWYKNTKYFFKNTCENVGNLSVLRRMDSMASSESQTKCALTHWGRMTHICVGKLTIIGSDNGLSPGRRQAIICTNAEILLIRPLRTNFSEILIEFHMFSIKNMHLKMSSAKWRSFCFGLNVLTYEVRRDFVYSRTPCWMTPSGQQHAIQNQWHWKKTNENMASCSQHCVCWSARDDSIIAAYSRPNEFLDMGQHWFR